MATTSCGGLPGYDAWKLRAPDDEPGYVDPDETQCTGCGAFVDYHDADEQGRCGKCEEEAQP